MKGPVIKYFCDGCENLVWGSYFSICKENSQLFIPNVGDSYHTPKECPFLIKTERRLKLQRINEKI